MSETSNSGKKTPKGQSERSLFGRGDSNAEPHADIDVPVYEGEIPEPGQDGVNEESEATHTPQEAAAGEDLEPEQKAPKEQPEPSVAEEAPKRPRDIYELVGRARPRRIEAPAPQAEAPAPTSEGNEAAALADPSAEESSVPTAQPEYAEQKTEVINLSGIAEAATGQGALNQDAEDPSEQDAEHDTALLGAGELSAGELGAGELGAATAITGVPGVAVADGDAEGAPEATAEPAEEQPEDPRRGTQSFGLAILRIVAGAVLLVTGLQTLFGIAGDPGISALESRLDFFNGSEVLAVAIPAAEVVAGGLLILGLLTPLGAALAFIVSAFMATFHLSGHQGSLWPYGLNPVIHQWALYALISFSLIFTGPGRASLDRSRSWARRPLASAWIFAVIGVVGFAALWLLTGGRNPF